MNSHAHAYIYIHTATVTQKPLTLLETEDSIRNTVFSRNPPAMLFIVDGQQTRCAWIWVLKASDVVCTERNPLRGALVAAARPDVTLYITTAPLNPSGCGLINWTTHWTSTNRRDTTKVTEQANHKS